MEPHFADPQRQPSPSDMGSFSTSPQPWLCPLTWDLTVQGAPTPSPLPLVTSGGHHWISVQKCSLEDPHPPPDIWWLLKRIQSANGQYTSYWNAFWLSFRKIGTNKVGSSSHCTKPKWHCLIFSYHISSSYRYDSPISGRALLYQAWTK